MSAFALVLTQDVAIDAPADVVWDVLTDVSAWTRYNPVVLDADGAVVDGRVRFGLRMAGRRVAFDVAISKADGRRLVWASRRWTVTGTRAWTIAEAGARATLEDRKTFTCGWFPVGWCYPRGVITAMSAAWLAAVKAEAERRA